MKRTLIFTAIAMTFGLPASSFASDPAAKAIAIYGASVDADSVRVADNASEQAAAVTGNTVSVPTGGAATGANGSAYSFNGAGGISSSAQNSGGQSKLQQAVAIDVAAGANGGAKAAAKNGSEAEASSLVVVRNLASQFGEVTGNLIEASDEGTLATGGNTTHESFNDVDGVAQSAQNSGVQSNLQQDVSVQADMKTGGGAKARAKNSSTAASEDTYLARNSAEQSGYTDGNIVHTTDFRTTVETGSNAVHHSFRNWNGVAQSAQNSGLQANVKQNVALQANLGESQGDASAAASDGSSAGAVNDDRARNHASQIGGALGDSTDVRDASTVGTGDNTLFEAFTGWSGISQNSQNSGIQSYANQQVAVQANGGHRSHGAKALAEEGSEAAAVSLKTARNVANQSGDQLAGTVSASDYADVDTGANSIHDALDAWTGISQNAQNSGLQSHSEQNVAVQVNSGHRHTNALAASEDGSLAVAVASHRAVNRADQSGDMDGNTIRVYDSTVSGGGNGIEHAFSGWAGISQNTQSAGVQSLTQQNAALQVNGDRAGGSANAAASAGSLAVLVSEDRERNVARQDGGIRENEILVRLGRNESGANAVHGSFSNWSGLSQNTQQSGSQSMIQQNVAVQVNTSTGPDDGASAQADLFSTAVALDVELDRNRAVQNGDVDGNSVDVRDTGPRGIVSGGNMIDASFNNWSGISQNAQGSGVQSLVQQNLSVQATLK